jgi:hypothetical protein
MTAATPAPRAQIHPLLLGLAGLAALLAIAALTRPYYGVTGDARLYVGAVLARLHPQTIGRDAMFLDDGQFGLSVFPPLFSPLVRGLGPALASLLVSLASLILWVVAAYALARRIAAPRLAWCVVVFALALPASYGGFGAFQYGESLAVPRPLVEAGVMTALAALLAGRLWVAGLFLLAATALNPIMALPGWLAGGLILTRQDHRWWGLAVLGLLGLAGAIALRVPLAERLITPIDAAWLAVLNHRAADLFVTNWPPAAWAQIGVQAATLVLAISILQGKARDLFIAVGLAAAAGVGVSLVFGDLLPMQLVAQLQPWRTLWLMGVLANGGLLLVTLHLWRQGDAGRCSLALLAAAWLLLDTSTIGALLAAAAGLSLAISVQIGRAPALSPLMARASLAAAGALALSWLFVRIRSLGGFLDSAHAAAIHPGWAYVAASQAPVLPLVALAIYVATRPAAPLSRGRFAAAAAVLLVLAASGAVLWDSRPPQRQAFDRFEPDPTLTALIASAPGPVLWLAAEDSDVWARAGRAGWVSSMQAGGAVFSRPLALGWDARMRRLVALGVISPLIPTPFAPGARDQPFLDPPAASLRALCADPNGPAAVVAPLAQSIAALAQAQWRSPVPEERVRLEDGRFVWSRTRDYAVVLCADLTARRPGAPASGSD